MKTTNEFFAGDNTRIFYYDVTTPHNYYRTKLEGAIEVYIHPYLSFGDYDNSCQVERSNVRVFLQDFGNDPSVIHWTGGHGSECILIQTDCVNEEIIETLAALDNYPAINDEDCSMMQMEMEAEDWEGWIKNDFKDAILKKYDLLDINCSDEILQELYYSLQETTNTYYEIEMGGNGYIKIESLINGLDEIFPENLQPEKW